MFYENEVMKFLSLQDKICKQQMKADTPKNQQKLQRLLNEKEKTKNKLKEVGKLAEKKSIFSVNDLVGLFAISLTIAEQKNHYWKSENGNFHILEDEDKSVITLPSDQIHDGKFQVYTFDPQKLEEDHIRILQPNVDLHNYEYLYPLINELIGKKIEMQKENFRTIELAYLISEFFMNHPHYMKNKNDKISSVYQKKK